MVKCRRKRSAGNVLVLPAAGRLYCRAQLCAGLLLALAGCTLTPNKNLAMAKSRGIIKEFLVAPSTAKIRNQNVVDKVEGEQERWFIVTAEVHAQNRMGAMLRKYAIVVLRFEADAAYGGGWVCRYDKKNAVILLDQKPTSLLIMARKAMNGWPKW